MKEVDFLAPSRPGHGQPPTVARRFVKPATSRTRSISPAISNLLVITDIVTASTAASNIQEQRPYRPLRRSPRLNRLPRITKITPQPVEPLSAGEKRSHPRKLQYSSEHVDQPSEPPPSTAHALQPNSRKRARDDPSSDSRKRPRKSHPPLVPKDRSGQETYVDPVDYWRGEGYRWPSEALWKSMDTNPAVGHLLARKKSNSSQRRKRSDSELAEQSSNTPSDQKSREAKSAPYRDARYSVLLATKGSFMDNHDLGVVEKSKELVRKLLEQEQPVPQDSLFRDDIFEATCRKVRDRNETRVIRDISLLIVPSAEMLTTYGARELACLTESVNEGWNNSISVTPTRPQSDYAVGFRREAFTEEQLKKLQPFVGELTDHSFFMATYYLYFPFLTCEVKCGAAALDVADRQNAHSMTLAVRAVVELFRLVKHEKELDREILAFSISHDHESVRIYGHYPVIEETKTTFYRHPILKFNFTNLEGKDKWTAYRFTKSVYQIWMPAHFKRLCSVIDALPADLDFELSQQSELRFSEPTGLSQNFANQYLSALNTESASSAQDDNSQLQPLEPSDTPDTSFTKDSAQGGTKKAKRSRR